MKKNHGTKKCQLDNKRREGSLIPRPSHRPVFVCLQCAKIVDNLAEDINKRPPNGGYCLLGRVSPTLVGLHCKMRVYVSWFVCLWPYTVNLNVLKFFLKIECWPRALRC